MEKRASHLHDFPSIPRNQSRLAFSFPDRRVFIGLGGILLSIVGAVYKACKRVQKHLAGVGVLGPPTMSSPYGTRPEDSFVDRGTLVRSQTVVLVTLQKHLFLDRVSTIFSRENLRMDSRI